MESLVGRKLGKYELTTLIGGGGMATVYKARHPGLDQQVAIKTLHPFLSADASFVDRFRREAHAVAALRHPNIVRVLDFDQQDELYYMVMEFIGGPSLSTVLTTRRTSGGLSLAEVGRTISPLCGAIDYAASRGMVHRDIKPANIMISDDGEPILTDYGIAKMIGSTSLTSPGTVVGSAHYMSPEQAQGLDCDVRSDLYSLGVVLFECLAGSPPFDGETTVTVLVKHISAPVPSIRSLRPNLPAGLEPMLARALAKQPQDRYEMGATFAEELMLALKPSKSIPAVATELVAPLPPIAVAPSGEYPAAPPAPPPTSGDYPAAPPAPPPTSGEYPAAPPAPSPTSGEYPAAPPPPPSAISGEQPAVGETRYEAPLAAPPPPPPAGEYAIAPPPPPAPPPPSGEYPAAPPPPPAPPPPSGEYPAAPPPPPSAISGEQPVVGGTRYEAPLAAPPAPPPGAPTAPYWGTPPPPPPSESTQAEAVTPSGGPVPFGHYDAQAPQVQAAPYPGAPNIADMRAGAPPRRRSRTKLILAGVAGVIVVAGGATGAALALRGESAVPENFVTTTGTTLLSTTTSLPPTSTSAGTTVTTAGTTVTTVPTTLTTTSTTAKPTTTTTVRRTTTTKKPTTTQSTSPPGTIGPGTTTPPDTIGPG